MRTIEPGGFLDGIAVAAGSLWVSDLDGNRLLEVDPTSASATAIKIPSGPLTVAANDTHVWVGQYNGTTVTRIDPATGKVDATIATGSQPVGITVVKGQLFVFPQDDDNAGYTGVDGTKLTPFPVSVGAGFASSGFGAVWVPDFTGGTNTVLKVDPATRTSTSYPVGDEPIQALAAGDSVWVSNTADSTVTRLDPATGAARATIDIPGGQTGGMTWANGDLWVASYAGRLVAEVDPATDAVIGTVMVPGPAENIASTEEGHLWVTESSGHITELAPHNSTP